MGFKSKRIYWWATTLVLLVALLLVGCNRAAPEPDASEPNGDQATAIPSTGEQVMATPTQAPGTEAGGASEVATETAEQGTEPTEEPAQEATPEPPPEPVEPEPTQETAPPAGEHAYTVMPGDTLYSIAQTYGVTVEEIAARNGIINVHQLEVGQVLVIPAAGQEAPGELPGDGEQTHIVRVGENLFRISLAYNMSFETVAAYNGIPWPYHIYPGQEIRIPPAE